MEKDTFKYILDTITPEDLEDVATKNKTCLIGAKKEIEGLLKDLKD